MVNELCRICAQSVTNKTKSLELFECKHNHILQKLKQLTGLMLKNNINLPKWMCTHCQHNLQEAYSFRENFLKVQAYLKAELNKGLIKTAAEKFDAKCEISTTLLIKHEDCADLSEINTSTEDDQNVINSKKNPSEYVCNKISPEVGELSKLEDMKTNYNELNTSYLQRNTAEVLDSNDNIDKNLKGNLIKSKCLLSTKLKTKTVNGKSTISNKLENNKLKNHDKCKDSGNKLKMFVCDQCGNHFYLRHHFLVHLRRHSGDKQYACEICPHKFFTNSELTRHMRKHTGERPFACKFCFRKFSDYSTRIKHERTHTNERPYTCTHCTKSFTNSYILKNHILTHTGEKLFSCSICHKSFSRRTHLAVHNRSVAHKQAVENGFSIKDKHKEV